jgi:NADH-quinone oxidoreductase subunit G
VNTEGRVQQSLAATAPPGEAREDWRIVRALSAALGRTLPVDTAAAVRQRLIAANPLFADAGVVMSAPWAAFGRMAPIADTPLRSSIGNFYVTNPICRASPTMAECVAAFTTPPQKKTGTDG